ncbi:GNAT family N-acetyltransferase [Anatilimnocola floriformis]|uniref:GNAT family N-acetyltransferase n=1 Tax=Anatilimnocola floriformis TaxID=2948575 RepID=UPI0020C27438|nr:GNAT family N-acetyltransferase [Anatilimnocola floriformis]
MTVENPAEAKIAAVDVKVLRPAQLTTTDWALWNTWQQENPALSSPYFRPEFTQAVSRVREDVEIAVLQRAGQTTGFLPFQRGQLNIGKPVGGKLCDFHGCIGPADLQFDPRQVLAGARLATWDFEHVPAAQTSFAPFAGKRDQAPGLELKNGYAGWCEQRREQGSQVVSKTMQKVRKLAREQGELSLELQSTSAEVFETLLAWKSAQYQLTGLADVFSFPWTRSLIEQLQAPTGGEFGGWMSVLRAGQKIVAICYSIRSRHVMHAWFTAYDRELSAYSPGLVMFLQMTEAWPQVGITRFELGKGDERFKWNLATDSQELMEGSVSRPTMATWLRSGWRTTRAWLDKSPVSGKLLQPIRQWLAYK